MTEALEPRFPPELEREIFLNAYYLYKASRTPSVDLMLVARRIHDWVAERKYCTLQQVNKDHRTLPERQLTPSSAEYYGPFIKHLIAGGDLNTDQIKTLLRHCPNLVDLALWSPHKTSLFVELLESSSRSSPLRSISTNFSSLSEDDITGPAFSKITHLDITEMGDIGSLSRWAVLARLPELTHLILNEVITAEVVRHLLGGCKNLQILVLAHQAEFDLGAEIRDHRLVLFKISRYTISDWMDFVDETGEDILSMAEKISRAKSAGYRDCHKRWISRYRIDENLMELGYRGSIEHSGT